MAERKFKGHGVQEIGVNIVAAVFPLVILLLIRYTLDREMWLAVCFATLMFVIMFAHPTYLFFEVKHLVHPGSMTGERDLAAILVFGSLSLLGLGLQVVTNIQLMLILGVTSNYFWLGALLLSFVAAIGGCLGLTDLVALVGCFWPPLIFKHLMIVLRNKGMMGVCLGTTVLLSVLTLVFR